MPEDEQWQPIEGFEGLYEVSDQGRVRSVDRYVKRRGEGKVGGGGTCFYRGRVLSLNQHRQGYRLVMLCKRCQEYVLPVHRLVAKAFCENPNGYDTVDHINGDKSDNRASNLEWVTQSENLRRAYQQGRPKSTKRCPIIATEKDGSQKSFTSQRKAAEYYGISATAVNGNLNKKWPCKNGVKFERMEAHEKTDIRTDPGYQLQGTSLGRVREGREPGDAGVSQRQA